jgi:prolyl 4-hydroxylase
MLVLYKEPRVIPDFITRSECDFLIKNSKNALKPSKIGDDMDGDKYNIRKSKTMNFYDKSHDVIQKILNKFSKITNTPLCNIEPIQVTKYDTGGFYESHIDCDDPHFLRPFTLIIYLNNDYEGGETFFNRINKKYKLDCGSALLFDNFDTSGNVTDTALHSGQLVTSGEKWICTIWSNKNNVC